MSLQYKCERCGKVAAIEYEDKRPIMPNSWMRIALIQKETRHIDICSDCIDAMIEFIGKAEIGAQLVTTKIDLEEVISSAVHHAFSVSTNNARKPKEFFAAYPWLDEIEENADHYQYMFCDEWVQYWGFIRILYSSVADSVAKWCYAKRNDLPWVDWDSIDYEQDREKEAESEPKDEPEPEAQPKPEAQPEPKGERIEEKPSSGAATDESTPLENFSCTNEIDGRKCIKEKGHKGDCSFLCDDPSCPGYAWPASKKRPHPMSTCKP
jgi:hypothetical protein